MPCVYITENLHNKELSISPWRYIGSDQNDDPEYYGSNRDLKRDIAFLGKDKFKKIVIKYYETIDNKELMSSQRIGELNNNALEWTVTTPEGIVHQVNALRAWCRENNVNFYEVYESRKGWTSIKYGAGKGGGRKKQEKTI